MRVPIRLAVLVVIALHLTLASSCTDDGEVTGPEPAQTLASFELTVPDSIAEWSLFSLSVRAVGDRGAKPLSSFSGSVTLTTTLGTITPSTLMVSGGVGSAEVSLSHPGQQTLTASAAGKTGSLGVVVTDVPGPPIPGDPRLTLEEAVRDSVFLPEPDDYSNDHPDLPGMYLSHNTVLMAFAVGTTVQQANDMLTPLGAELAGGIQGVAGHVPSILMVRLPTTTHQEMEAALTTMRSSPLVFEAVQDVLLGAEAVPPSAGTPAPGWEWHTREAGVNHYLKRSRVPQMWNLNRAIEKQRVGTGIGIVDLGFAQHEDLIFQTFGQPINDFHGTVIAGTIGAVHANGLGIEGIYPFIRSQRPLGRMVTYALPVGILPGGPLARLTSAGQLMVNGIRLFVNQEPDLRVINVSLGYNWAENGISPITNAAMNVANGQGTLMAQVFAGIASAPLIVVSAGNDNGADARYGSPMANAALAQNAPNILVVENVHWDGVDWTRYPASNVGGHISAPGFLIFSTNTGPSGYADHTGNEPHVGTSYAAGMVSGVAAYVLAAAQNNLDATEIKQILRNNTFVFPAGGGAQRRLDAWASVMGIDALGGGDDILRMMLDIDDGTPDGNQRVDYEAGPDFPDYDEEDADGDRGIGDERVDMSDFRRWRDWYLIVRADPTLALDGSPSHLKHDVNDNAVSEDAAQEGVYPRGDFNGDGLLSLADSAFVPGAVNARANDLDVLKRAFDDPDYDAADLDTLVHSVDVTIDPSTWFELNPQSSSVTVKIEPWDMIEMKSQERDIPRGAPPQVMTMKYYDVGQWIRFVTGGEGDGTIESDFGPVARWPGSDVMMRPITTHYMNEKETFLHHCLDGDAVDARSFRLADWDVQPGDQLLFDGEGGFWWDDAHTLPRKGDVVAVFSSSDVILDGSFLERVPGAIDAGLDHVTEPTKPVEQGGVQFCILEPTDIPQDFILRPEAFVRVPDGATHLFIGTADDYYSDNEPGPDIFRVDIAVMYAPDYDPQGPP